jgi:hypothetical protein
VRYTWLAAARAVFKWGVPHGKIEVNPFESCVVEVPRKPETRETGKAFNDAEVSTILSAALRVAEPVRVTQRTLGRCPTWVPWLGLLAYVEAVKTRLGPKGPLFYCPQIRPSRRHPPVRARERLAEWVRRLRVTAPCWAHLAPAGPGGGKGP